MGAKVPSSDSVANFLFQRSCLTEVQLETLVINNAYMNAGLREKVQKRARGSVTKGSFLRTLRQAQGNIERSAYTIILTEYLGLVGEGAPVSLLRIGGMLRQLAGADVLDSKVSMFMERITEVVETMSGRAP